jgi:hypothetical protein
MLLFFLKVHRILFAINALWCKQKNYPMQMRTEVLHLKLQGLWVGAALGELYAKGWFREGGPSSRAIALTVQEALPQTYRLCLLAARWLKAAGDINADLWHCQRWQDSLLNALPLTFLHSTLAESAYPSNARPESLSSIIAVIKTLDWLQRAEPPKYLLSYLLQTPGLQETVLAETLGGVYEKLSDRHGLPIPNPIDASSPLETPDRGMAQVLYLLLSTPNDFGLTVRRANLAFTHQPELQILVAALSGFHNGFASLPLAWRFHLQTLQWSVAMPLEESLLTLGNLCAAQWAGCYIPRPDRDWSTVVVSAPGQLRPR